MVTTITQDILTSKRNNPGTICNVRKGIVIHYTANYGKNANARANRNYFNTTTTYASTHFLVDDKEIIQALPLNVVGWSVGATSYTSTGKKLFHNGLQPNYTTVSIEMCVNSNSEFAKVEENTVWLTVYLMRKYNLTINDIYRHYDITGKNCPSFYISDNNAWKKFLSKVKDAYGDISRKEQISLDRTIIKNIITLDTMNIRKGPNTSYEVLKTIPKDTILNVFEVIDGWYKVKTNDNIIGYMSSNSKYSKNTGLEIGDDNNTKNSPSLDITGAIGEVITKSVLNIRKEASTYSDITGTYKIGERVNLLEEKGRWYRTDKGWVFSEYIKRIDERYNATLTNNANIRDVNLKILCTGKIGDKILTSTKKKVINGIPVYACKYNNIKGYIQEGSFKRL